MFETQGTLPQQDAVRHVTRTSPIRHIMLAAVAFMALWATLHTAQPVRAASIGGVAADRSVAASFYLPVPDPGPITDLEQRLLTGLNVERMNNGLAPLAADPEAAQIARIRVRQMVDQDYFGHVDPDGNTMYVALLGLDGVSYQVAGENLALNNYSIAESPERAVSALMRSPSHRDNILYDGFTSIGVGELTAADGRHFYAMIFLG